MSLPKIPDSFDFELDAMVDLDGKLDVTIPTSYAIDIPTDFTFGVKELPPIEIKPIDLSLRLKEIPLIRGHFPLNYKLGLSLLGLEVACIHLCGHGQVITEPYVPYPCEPGPRREPQPVPDRRTPVPSIGGEDKPQ